MAEANIPGSLEGQVEYYKRRCQELESENAKLREELLALKTTVSAVVARSIDAKADTASGRMRRYKKPGRRVGHEGASRSRPERIDETVELDHQICPRCGGVLSQNHTDHSYTRVVEDVVPARVITTKYVVRRRYCCRCRRQVSPPIPNVVQGNERFGPGRRTPSWRRTVV